MYDGDDQAARRRREARAVMQALHQAVQAARQQARPQVRRLADRRFVQRARGATAGQPLALQLHGSTVSVPEGVVWSEADGGDLVPWLWQLGIGALHLDAGVAGPALTTLVEVLAGAHGGVGAVEDDVVARLRAAGAVGVRLEPADADPFALGPDLVPGLSPFAQLPPPLPLADSLHRPVEREADLNLRVLTARWLLQDLETAPDDAAAACLGPLLGGMLEHGDAQGAAAVLEQACNHPRLSPAITLALRTLADERLRGEALAEQLQKATPDDLLALVALAIQLGPSAVQHLCTEATKAGVAVPDWILDTMLPPPA